MPGAHGVIRETDVGVDRKRPYGTDRLGLFYLFAFVQEPKLDWRGGARPFAAPPRQAASS